MSHVIRIGAFYRKELITWLKHFNRSLSPSTISLKYKFLKCILNLKHYIRAIKYRCDFKAMSEVFISLLVPAIRLAVEQFIQPCAQDRVPETKPMSAIGSVISGKRPSLPLFLI